MIWWVMGGTAVGKKRFIQRAVDEATRPAFVVAQRLVPAWIADGPVSDDLVLLNQTVDVMVRWQWGRDEHLVNLLKGCPQIRHALIVLSVPLMAQMSRVALREGVLKWDAATLASEARDIYELVHRLAARHRMPVLYVDATDDTYPVRLKVDPWSETP